MNQRFEVLEWFVPKSKFHKMQACEADSGGNNADVRAKVRLTATLLGAAALLGFAVLFFGSREPSYQGKPLSAWLRELDGGLRSQGNFPPPAVNAIREMGTNALPHLMAMLRQRDSKLAAGLNAWLTNQQWIKVRIPLASDNRRRALWGLSVLGTNAFTVLPEVSRLTDPLARRFVGFLALGIIPHLCGAQGFESVPEELGGCDPGAQVWELRVDSVPYIVISLTWWSPRRGCLYLLTKEATVLDRAEFTVGGPETRFSLRDPQASGTNCITLAVSRPASPLPGPKPGPQTVTVRLHQREVHEFEVPAELSLARSGPEDQTAIEVRFAVQKHRFVILNPGSVQPPTNSPAALSH